MKKLFLIAIGAMLLAACEKECRTMTVVRNCTGTYLRDGNKEFQVCNASSLSAYADGDKIKADIRHVVSCTQPGEDAICLMVYPNDGLIEVKTVYN